MALDRIALILKVGDCETAPGKEWAGLKHLDPICVIDELQWNAVNEKIARTSGVSFTPLTLEDIISEEMHKIFCVMQVDRKLLPFLVDATQATHDLADQALKTDASLQLAFRPRTYRFDLKALQAATGDKDIESKLLDKDAKVGLINCTEISTDAFIDATLLSNDRKIADVNAIIGGSATVGAGMTYATWALAWADVGNLATDLTFQQQTTITETAGAVCNVSLGGHTFDNNALPANYGDATYTGLLLTLNHTAHGFQPGVEGPGTLKMHDICAVAAQATTQKGLFATGTIDAEFYYYIYRNIYNGASLGANGVRLFDNTPIVYMYSNIIFNTDTAAFVYGSTSAGNAASIIENNTVHDTGTGGSGSGFNVNSNAGTFRNNLSYNNAGNAFDSIGSATGYNNASDGTSNADGNWATGIGNKTSLTIANEVESSDYQDGDAFDRPILNSNLYRTGVNPGIADVACNNFSWVRDKIDIGAKAAYGVIYVKKSDTTALATNSITLSHTIANGNKRLLLVSLAWEGATAPTCTGVTYNGVAMTLVGTAGPVGSTTTNKVALYYLLEANLPVAGAYNVIASFGGNFTGCLITALEFINVSALDTYATNTATSTTDISTNITPAEDNELIVDGVVSGGENTFLSYAWQIDRYDHNIPSEPGVSHGGSTAVRAKALIAQVGETASSSQARLAQIVAAFKLGAEAAGSGNWFLLQMKNEVYNSINTQLR